MAPRHPGACCAVGRIRRPCDPRFSGPPQRLGEADRCLLASGSCVRDAVPRGIRRLYGLEACAGLRVGRRDAAPVGRRHVCGPALRAVGILPTPKLAIGSVRIDFPYRDYGFGGATAEGAKQELFISFIAHPYRSETHPGEPIDLVINARSDLMKLSRPSPDNGYRGNNRHIEQDLNKALQQPDAASKPLMLRFDFSGSRSFRSVVRYLPNYPDVVFTARVRSHDVTFEELESVLDRFIAERVRPSMEVLVAPLESR